MSTTRSDRPFGHQKSKKQAIESRWLAKFEAAPMAYSTYIAMS